MATAKKAVKKSAGTAIVKWDEKFSKYAKEAKEQLKNIGAGGVSVKFGRGTIEVAGASMLGGKLECVIVGSCALNAWYAEAFDADNPAPPDCYAFSVINDDPDMKPHEQAAQPQSDLCSTCTKNEYGTALVGKGKACGNNIRLGILTGKDVEDAATISTAELAIAKVSPTNLKNYKGYVEAIEQAHGRPTWAVITEITSHNDNKTQIRLEFKFVELIEDDEVLEALEKRFLNIQDQLQTPFAAATERPAKKAVAKKGTAKFAGKGKR